MSFRSTPWMKIICYEGTKNTKFLLFSSFHGALSKSQKVI